MVRVLLAMKRTMSHKEKTKKKTLVLLDVHAILHRAFHALPDFTSPKGEPTGALYGVVAMLLKIFEELSPDYVVACYDLPGPTYRHEVYKEYKAGRVKTDPTLIAQIKRSRDIFDAFSIPMYESVGFEADDILGTIVEKTKEMSDVSLIIASGDMDTLQLVQGDRVKVYTLKKGIRDTLLYNEKAVKERFGFPPSRIIDYKGLRGDPSDNIPGVKGIGDKSATSLISLCGSIESIYKQLKKDESELIKAGITPRICGLLRDNEEEAIFSKMLATIRKDAPIQFSVPTMTWKESINSEKIEHVFNELGFRTLYARVMLFLGKKETISESVHNEDVQEVNEAKIALWLISSDTTDPSFEDVIRWGKERDASNFKETYALLLETLKKQDLWRVFDDIERPLIPVLRNMEEAGIAIDVEYLKSLSKKMHHELDSLQKQIYELSGTEFNINSPKQLGVVLYDTLSITPKRMKKTAGGQRSTRESELQKLIDLHPIIALVLRYRELQKLTGTYIDPLPTLVKNDGRIHTTFLQAGASTGRMATQNPSIQNIPIRTEEGRAIRGAFIAKEGWKLVSIDYSQIELRVAAMLSGDRNLIDIFKNGEDVHSGVASRVFKVKEVDVTKEMRRRAKIINFGILYGMGVTALRENLGGETTREEAQAFINAYFTTFTRVAEYLEETKEFARTHGYTTTYFGRRRYFPGMTSGAQFVRAQAERMAINAPVQGTAADIIRIAMIRIAELIKKEDGANMLLQVHDELVFEVQKEKLEPVIPLMKECMESVMDDTNMYGVPLQAVAKVGDNWEYMEIFK